MLAWLTKMPNKMFNYWNNFLTTKVWLGHHRLYPTHKNYQYSANISQISLLHDQWLKELTHIVFCSSACSSNFHMGGWWLMAFEEISQNEPPLRSCRAVGFVHYTWNYTVTSRLYLIYFPVMDKSNLSGLIIVAMYEPFY